MTTELTALACSCLLALAHVLIAGFARTRQYGHRWNAGARDEAPAPPNALVGRLARAQANFFESFPVFAAAVLIVAAADLENGATAVGAWSWVAARAVYLPVYAAGIAYLRSLVWLAGLAGLVTLLVRALTA